MTVVTPADAALAFEKRAETVVTLKFAAELRAIAVALMRADATLTARAGGQPPIGAIIELRAAIVRRVEKLAPEMGFRFDDMIENGIAFGVRQSGGRVLGELPTRAVGDVVLAAEPEMIDRRATDRLRDVVTHLLVMPWDAVQMAATVTGPARHAEAEARWAANRAINAGIAHTAREFGESLAWVAERNACHNCLSYQGQVVVPGASFTPLVQYAKKPIRPRGALPYPPLHPNCRCAVRRYGGPAPTEDASANDLASALAREARRSIARGLSDYDSRPERQRAAGALLARGANLAPSVMERARRDVARGAFTKRPAITSR